MDSGPNSVPVPDRVEQVDGPNGPQYHLDFDATTEKKVVIHVDQDHDQLWIHEIPGTKRGTKQILEIIVAVMLLVLLSYLGWQYMPGPIVIVWAAFAIALPLDQYYFRRTRVVLVGGEMITIGSNRKLLPAVALARDDIADLVIERANPDTTPNEGTTYDLLAVGTDGKRHRLACRSSPEEMNWIAVQVRQYLRFDSNPEPDWRGGSIAAPTPPPALWVQPAHNETETLIHTRPTRFWLHWPLKAAAIGWLVLLSFSFLGYALGGVPLVLTISAVFLMMPPSVILWLLANQLRDDAVSIRVTEQDIQVMTRGDDPQGCRFRVFDVKAIELIRGPHFILESRLATPGAPWLTVKRGYAIRFVDSEGTPFLLRLPYNEDGCTYVLDVIRLCVEEGHRLSDTDG